MNHESFLSDLTSSLPDLHGAFLFTPQADILATHIGTSISDFDPLAIGKKITTIAKNTSPYINNISQIHVTCDNMILSGRQLPDQNWLIIVHSPELSSGMIRMTLQFALNNNSQENETLDRPAETPVTEWVAAEPGLPKESTPIDTLALMSPGSPLASHLNELQDALANFIGPAAIPVFQDVLTAWCQEHTPALTTLKFLIPLLDKEIEDSEDINSFHATIKDLFPQE
jgi:hypothetical protein